MGYDIDRFVNSVDDDFKCSICLAVLENPLATPCGHVFCANCVLPWVVEHSTCPLKCGKFSSRELNNVLPLRNLILKLEIRCDNHSRGCGKICKIAMLGQHLEECENRPVNCSNKGCQKVLDVKDRIQHETVDCEFRPAGVCDRGCGLPVPMKEAGEHDCVKALLAHVASIQAKLAGQERSVKKTSLRHSKREKSLLAQIACYQNEIHMQGLRYQKQMNECRAEIEYLSSLATLEKRHQPTEETELTVQLKRNTGGSLGFNIIGGTKAETGLSDGIVVSKIVEDSSANRSPLRIHDRVMKVNGKDLSKASHEEAVEAFKNATEPIIVQVLRRTENTSQVGSDKMVCNAGTQTELQSGDLLWKVLQTYQIEKSDSLEGLCEITPQDPLASLDTDLYDDLDAMDNLGMPIIDEDDLDRAFDFEYEDITLKKASKDEKLGLTLCYGGDEGDGGIFISEVEPGSIASEDDRLREGDQILQINGEDVENREQALKLFSEQEESLTLLVCRPQYQLDDCLLERGNALLDELKMDMLEQTHQEAMQYTAFHHYQNLMQDEDGRTDTTGTTENNSLRHEKDSGVGRATDDSVRNDSDGGEGGSTRKYPLSMNSGDLRYSNESFTSNELVEHELNNSGQGLSVEDCQKFQAELESKCDKHVRSDTDESYQGKESKVMRLGSDSMDTTSQSGDSLNRPAKLMTPEEDNDIDVLIVDTGKNEEGERWSHKSKVSPSLSTGSSISDVNVLTDVLTDVTSMSSTVSGPLDSNKLGSPDRKHTDENQNRDEAEDSAHVSLIDKSQRKTPQGPNSRQHRAPRTVPGSPSHRSKSSSSSRERPRSSSSSGSSKDKAKENKLKENKLPLDKVPPLSSALPYPRRPCTNPHIRAQVLQRNPYLMQQVASSGIGSSIFSQNLKLKHQNYFLRRNLESMGGGSSMGSMQSLQSVPGYAKHYRSYLHLVKQNEENLGREDNREREAKEKVATEWKVKIRSDGTRYITRKASTRDRVLKERENKLREERGGLTTDDEAVSEMKLGKYWSREDRKKHLEKARDQKRRREFMHRARMECLQEQAEDEGRREPDIVELSRKKMLKRKGRKLMLDDFTTVQEMMVHATKGSPDSSRDYNPLLNVTMV